MARRIQKAEDADITNHEDDFANGIKPRNNVSRHIHINHGPYIEKGISRIQKN